MALVTMKQLVDDAWEKGTCIPAFNVGSLEMVRGALRAAEELDVPVIIQIAERLLKYSPLELIGPGMVQAARESRLPVAVNFDHSSTFEVIEKALQLGFGDVKVQRVNKPMKGHFDKNDVACKKELKEFRLDDCDSLNVGDIIKADTFAVGDVVDVAGTSKGKGYTGAIKRHNQHRLKETHGTGPVARQAGSMGACSSPSRIYKGKGMAGHMGAERVTVQNLEVVKIDAENNLIAIKGAVPGAKGSIVYIVDSVKA